MARYPRMSVNLPEQERLALRVSVASLPSFDPVGLWNNHEGMRHLIVEHKIGGLALLDQGMAYQVGASDLWVDFSDAATRDQVARWEAARIGLELGSTAPEWGCHSADLGHWHLFSRPNFAVFGPEERFGSRQVAAFAELDPRNDLRLSDGSRWVDARALVLVATRRR